MIKTTIQYFCDCCWKELPTEPSEFILPAYVVATSEDSYGGSSNFTRIAGVKRHLCNQCASEIAQRILKYN